MPRHGYRLLLAAAGVTMLACLARDQWLPHLLGVAVAAFAFVVGARSLAVAYAATRIALGLLIALAGTAVAAGLAAHVVPVAAVLELVVACGFAVVVGFGFTRGDEPTLAMFAIALGAAQTVWFVFVVPELDPDRMALAAAIAALGGGMGWQRAVRSRTSRVLPEARSLKPEAGC